MGASQKLFIPFLGLTVFDARKGLGSFVTFGLTTTPASPTEEFYVWVYMCSWRISESGAQLAHSESSDDEIVSAVSKFNGKRLEGLVLHSFVTQEGLFHGASLIFEGSFTMKLYQYEDSDPDTEIFMTRNSAGTWISYLSDGRIETEAKA